ncbi:MAG: zinc-dependent peptidase [Chitinophagaceae bacterium]|nr:zinc-dependent peptidase [Chitinophagaceae bacterium]
MLPFILFALIASIMVYALWWMRNPGTKSRKVQQAPEQLAALLEAEVHYYKKLDADKKESFAQRVQGFLEAVKITGIKTEVTDTDKVLLGASAIIPIFAFPNWTYPNLDEILVYPDTFDDAFSQSGAERSIAGMVGDGPLNNKMVISQYHLRQDFLNNTGKGNTAIHEFVHLVDKSDGSTDGVPEVLIRQPYVMPWLELIHQKVADILKRKSDINPYGATNQAEFFAVASEYFFERPDLLREKHPELYQALSEIFAQEQA